MSKEKQTSKTRIINTVPTSIGQNEWHVQKKFLGIWWTVYSSWYKYSCLEYVAKKKEPEYYE